MVIQSRKYEDDMKGGITHRASGEQGRRSPSWRQPCRPACPPSSWSRSRTRGSRGKLLLDTQAACCLSLGSPLKCHHRHNAQMHPIDCKKSLLNEVCNINFCTFKIKLDTTDRCCYFDNIHVTFCKIYCVRLICVFFCYFQLCALEWYCYRNGRSPTESPPLNTLHSILGYFSIRLWKRKHHHHNYWLRSWMHNMSNCQSGKCRKLLK